MKIRHIKGRAHVNRSKDCADETLCLPECSSRSVTFKVREVKRLELRDSPSSGLKRDRSLVECPNGNI
jgi:hypothetical protein